MQIFYSIFDTSHRFTMSGLSAYSHTCAAVAHPPHHPPPVCAASPIVQLVLY